MDKRTARDPRIGELLETTKAIELVRYEGVTFRDQDVWLDGGSFSSCRFENCNLIVEFGHFMMDGTISVQDCKIGSAPPADRLRYLIGVLQSLPTGPKH